MFRTGVRCLQLSVASGIASTPMEGQSTADLGGIGELGALGFFNLFFDKIPPFSAWLFTTYTCRDQANVTVV